MFTRQISWLRVFCVELKVLGQPEMPVDRYEEVMGQRDVAPDLFRLYCNLLKDNLILGLDNILDSAGSGQKLTLPYVVADLGDDTLRQECEGRLADIKRTKCYRAIKIARNHVVAHSERATVVRFDQIAASGIDPATGVNFNEDLSILALDALTNDVTVLASRALSKRALDFMLPDWKGASALFDHLRRDSPPA
jgi:hypothetical protein